MSNTAELKVKLVEKGNTSNMVVFEATPDLTENRNVNYKSMEPVHMPGAIHVYNNTSSRTYSVGNIRLFSRTREEASKNLERVNMLRSWTMPRFGINSVAEDVREHQKLQDQSDPYDWTAGASSRLKQVMNSSIPASAKQSQYRELFPQLGAPPAVVLLSAYSDTQHRGNVFRVPVVVTNLSIPYPSDVDYIPTLDGTPFPTVMTVDLQLLETHSPREYSNFSLDKYRTGQLNGF